MGKMGKPMETCVLLDQHIVTKNERIEKCIPANRMRKKGEPTGCSPTGSCGTLDQGGVSI